LETVSARRLRTSSDERRIREVAIPSSASPMPATATATSLKTCRRNQLRSQGPGWGPDGTALGIGLSAVEELGTTGESWEVRHVKA
jgi:hypothetical protein